MRCRRTVAAELTMKTGFMRNDLLALLPDATRERFLPHLPKVRNFLGKEYAPTRIKSFGFFPVDCNHLAALQHARGPLGRDFGSCCEGRVDIAVIGREKHTNRAVIQSAERHTGSPASNERNSTAMVPFAKPGGSCATPTNRSKRESPKGVSNRHHSSITTSRCLACRGTGLLQTNPP